MTKKADIAVCAIDARQFYKAIADYAAVGHKDFATAVNRKTRDAFLQASRVAPRAARGRIRARYNGAYPYFSKCVAEAKGYQQTAYTDKRGRTRSHIFSNAERTAYWKAVVRRALSRIGFVRAYLKSCADSVNDVCHLNTKGRPARLTGDSAFTCYVRPATREQETLHADARYGYRRKNGSATIIDQILETSLQKGFALVEADTREYIEKKLSENARAHSA